MNLRAQSVTIGIVEDQPLYRNMLAVALSTDPQFNVMWAVGTVAEDRNALNSQRPAVLILDIDLPDGNGVALGVTVRRHLPHIGILLLSAHDAMDLLLDLPADVRNGWSYLSKTSSTSPQPAGKCCAETVGAHRLPLIEPPVRIELTTYRLQGDCSATELRRPGPRATGYLTASSPRVHNFVRIRRTAPDRTLGLCQLPAP